MDSRDNSEKWKNLEKSNFLKFSKYNKKCKCIRWLKGAVRVTERECSFREKRDRKSAAGGRRGEGEEDRGEAAAHSRVWSHRGKRNRERSRGELPYEMSMGESVGSARGRPQAGRTSRERDMSIRVSHSPSEIDWWERTRGRAMEWEETKETERGSRGLAFRSVRETNIYLYVHVKCIRRRLSKRTRNVYT